MRAGTSVSVYACEGACTLLLASKAWDTRISCVIHAYHSNQTMYAGHNTNQQILMSPPAHIHMDIYMCIYIYTQIKSATRTDLQEHLPDNEKHSPQIFRASLLLQSHTYWRGRKESAASSFRRTWSTWTISMITVRWRLFNVG